METNQQGRARVEPRAPDFGSTPQLQNSMPFVQIKLLLCKYQIVNICCGILPIFIRIFYRCLS